jgi:hypothetical protein
MRLMVQAPLDLGVTLGVGDEALDALSKSRALASDLAPLMGDAVRVLPVAGTHELGSPPDLAIPYGAFPSMGKGLIIRTHLNRPYRALARQWINDAIFIAENGHKERKKGHCPPIVVPILKTLSLYSITLHVFSHGVTYLCLEAAGVPTDLASLVFDVFDSLEFAGYHDSRLETGELSGEAQYNATNAMIRCILNIVARYAADDDMLVQMSERKKGLGDLPEYVDIRWFSGLLVLDEGEIFIKGRVEQMLRDRVPDGLERITSYDAEIFYNPRFSALMPRGSERQYPHRVMYIMMASDVAFLLAQTYEIFLKEKFKGFIESVTHSRKRPTLTSTELRTIRYLTDFIDVSINLRNLTNSVDDAKFITKLDQSGRLGDMRSCIRSYSESIYAIESHVISEREQKTATFLNGLMAVLTLVSLLSVVAALVQVFQALNLIEGAFSRELREESIKEELESLLREKSIAIDRGNIQDSLYKDAPLSLERKHIYIALAVAVVVLLSLGIGLYVLWRRNSQVR